MKSTRQRRFLQPRVRGVRFRRRCVVGRYRAICCTRYTFPSNYSAGKTENCHKLTRPHTYAYTFRTHFVYDDDDGGGGGSGDVVAK